jgi:hypothetical protein
VTVADDEIYERYQAKAIDETNALGHDIAEWLGERHPGAAPVLGTGHPLADIMLVKHRPMPAEVQEGVAFFGRAGQAILKSLQRMRIDPLMLYGTACLKAAIDPTAEDLVEARSWPMVVLTYWKLEKRPRRPLGADSTMNVVAAANSPPTDRPWMSLARVRMIGASTPTAA